MRLTTALFLVGMLMIAGLAPWEAAAPDGTADQSIFALRIVKDAGEVYGTSVLIGREDREHDAVLYFLTSSHLFRTPEGERQPPERAIHLQLDEEDTLEVKRNDVFVGGGVVGVAVFRTTTTATTTCLPRRVVYDSPPADTVFLVSGYDRNGARESIVEHVRFKSTRLVVGDRDASGLLGCVGAPAIWEGGVFGVVSECDANRSPVITLLWMAHSFIERYVPRQPTHTRP